MKRAKRRSTRCRSPAEKAGRRPSSRWGRSGCRTLQAARDVRGERLSTACRAPEETERLRSLPRRVKYPDSRISPCRSLSRDVARRARCSSPKQRTKSAARGAGRGAGHLLLWTSRICARRTGRRGPGRRWWLVSWCRVMLKEHTHPHMGPEARSFAGATGMSHQREEQLRTKTRSCNSGLSPLHLEIYTHI